MTVPLQLIAVLTLILTSITLIRPRTGWGRIALFIPKLFSGSFIFLSGVAGLLVAITAWLINQDRLSLVLGFSASLIAFRYIYRIFRRGLDVGRATEANCPTVDNDSRGTMLSSPWVIIWKEQADVAWQRDVQIGQHIETGGKILADLWYPSDQTNHSGLGLIFFHGSGWHYADKDFGTRHFFRHLTSQGHVIADIAYTLSPEADLFGMVADVKRAIAWMKNSTHGLVIKDDRIILMGGSAGGHLALLAAYTPNHPELDPPDISCDTAVHGVISYYGPPNLRAQYERFKELPGLTGRTKFERFFMRYLESRFGFEVLPVHLLLPEFLGGDPSMIPEVYDLGSPSIHVGSHCPPTLFLQGMHDFSGLTPEVRRLHEALLDAGCSSFLMEFPDTEHGFDLYKPILSPAAQAATYVTERFLLSLI
jgi:acetyl esterase/lipase